MNFLSHCFMAPGKTKPIITQIMMPIPIYGTTTFLASGLLNVLCI
jgi:hypothetical protein